MNFNLRINHRTNSLRILAALPALLAVAAFAFTPAAQARPLVGVGDNGPAMFLDPNFQDLHTRISRKIIPYDFQHSSFELDQLRAWVTNATALGIDPLIALEHSHKYPQKLPSVGEYARSIAYLRANFPEVRSISPWNEANHPSQPTWQNPRRAAQYFRVVRKSCSTCTIVAADVLDQKNMLPWIRAFQQAAGGEARLWGLHSYIDSNYGASWHTSATRRLLGAVKGKVWLTEVGGIVSFKHHFKYDEHRAASAVGRALRLATMSPRIERIYLYSWFGVDQPKTAPSYAWDSGLVSATGKPRAGFRVLRDWLARNGG
jgi:hypothetical protein